MTLLLLTLLLLHQGYTLVPVVTVELGQSATLTCAFSMKYQSNTWLYWYKQNVGDTLNLILIQQRRTTPSYGPQFSASRFSVTSTEDSSNLTIIAVIQQDEGMYHCAQRDTLESTWGGIYLFIKGNSKRTTSYNVLQQPAISYEARPADSETLQCSVLADSENTTCSEEPSVFWFRARSEKSFPDLIYTDGKRSESCEKRADSQKRCFYNFSKNVSSSDVGTYYCAVATCGKILLGNGANLEIIGFSLESREAIIVIFFLSAALAISLIYIAVLVCSIRRSKCGHCQEAVDLKQKDGQNRQQIGEERRMYSATIFTIMETDNTETKKTAERKLMFSPANAFSL